MHFNPRTITVTDNKGRTYSLDALAALHVDGTPVGLAVHPVYTLGPGPMTSRPDEYTLTHVPSGVRLHGRPVPTEGTARRWLELVAPLTDWTQPRDTLDACETLRLLVAVARAQALTEGEEEWEVSPVSSFPVFRLEALTPLLEWISYAMEWVGLPPGGQTRAGCAAGRHSEVARRFNGSLCLPDSLPVPPVVS